MGTNLARDLAADERAELELLRRNRNEDSPGPWIQRAFDALGSARANADLSAKLLALLKDAAAIQRSPCDHKVIGKPGCITCDPRLEGVLKATSDVARAALLPTELPTDGTESAPVVPE